MRTWILLILAGTLGVSGVALAQDPNNAYIPDIQNHVFPESTFVTVREVVVTGVAGPGLWVQEPGATSFEYAGIWVYTSATPQVAVGEMVDVSGEAYEYRDVTEIGHLRNRLESSLRSCGGRHKSGRYF